MADIVEIAKDLAIPALAGSLVTLVLTRQFERTNQKRVLFAEAYEAVLGWQEMLYRVRRRGKGEEVERELINQFHELQEKLNYYQGILAAESKSLGKSYKQFVRVVKKENEALIQTAWESKIRRPSEGTPAKDKHPDIHDNAETFLKDIRQWLAWWQLSKLAVWWRYRNV